jgi:hypothetical protein
MKIPLVKTTSDVRHLKGNATTIRCYCYLTFPLVKQLLIVVPKLKEVILTPSRRRSASAVKYLKQNSIKLRIEGEAGAPPKYPKETCESIRRLAGNGYSYSYISKRYDIPNSSIHYILHERKS